MEKNYEFFRVNHETDQLFCVFELNSKKNESPKNEKEIDVTLDGNNVDTTDVVHKDDINNADVTSEEEEKKENEFFEKNKKFFVKK